VERDAFGGDTARKSCVAASSNRWFDETDSFLSPIHENWFVLFLGLIFFLLFFVVVCTFLLVFFFSSR
jgi:hypothetical protein